MLGLSKLERTLNAIAKGEPFTIGYATYRLFRKDDVFQSKYGYFSSETAHRTQMMQLESSSRSFSGRADLHWTDYSWKSSNLCLADIVVAIENDILSLGVAKEREHKKRYFACLGHDPRP